MEASGIPEVVAIVGSRGFRDPELVDTIVARLHKLHPNLLLISGGAPGVDTFAENAADAQGFCRCDNIFHRVETAHVHVFPAKWRDDQGNYDRSAGFRRNEVIVRHSLLVIAFFADGPRTNGTSNTVGHAKRLGVPVLVYHEGKWTDG